MAGFSSSDTVVLGVGVVIAGLYLFKDAIFAPSKSKSVPVPTSKSQANGSGNPRDFVAKMKETVSCPVYSLMRSVDEHPFAYEM